MRIIKIGKQRNRGAASAKLIMSGCGSFPAHSLCLNGTNMNLIRWINRWLTHRGKALLLYRAGMAKANKRDYHGAIADYSDAIRAPDIPIDVKAMATYNRALAYTAISEDEKAAEDLAAMLEMAGLPENIKTEARQRRERIKKARREQG